MSQLVGIEWRDTTVNVIRYTEFPKERLTVESIRQRIAAIHEISESNVIILSIT